MDKNILEQIWDESSHLAEAMSTRQFVPSSNVKELVCCVEEYAESAASLKQIDRVVSVIDTGIPKLGSLVESVALSTCILSMLQKIDSIVKMNLQWRLSDISRLLKIVLTNKYQALVSSVISTSEKLKSWMKNTGNKQTITLSKYWDSYLDGIIYSKQSCCLTFIIGVLYLSFLSEHFIISNLSSLKESFLKSLDSAALLLERLIESSSAYCDGPFVSLSREHFPQECDFDTIYENIRKKYIEELRAQYNLVENKLSGNMDFTSFESLIINEQLTSFVVNDWSVSSTFAKLYSLRSSFSVLSNQWADMIERYWRNDEDFSQECENILGVRYMPTDEKIRLITNALIADSHTKTPTCYMIDREWKSYLMYPAAQSIRSLLSTLYDITPIIPSNRCRNYIDVYASCLWGFMCADIAFVKDSTLNSEKAQKLADIIISFVLSSFVDDSLYDSNNVIRIWSEIVKEYGTKCDVMLCYLPQYYQVVNNQSHYSEKRRRYEDLVTALQTRYLGRLIKHLIICPLSEWDYQISIFDEFSPESEFKNEMLQFVGLFVN